MPRVRVSEDIGTPLVTGMFHPIIMLPAGGFEALSEREQRLALCHELTHIKRKDLWLGCVPAVAERVFFFHPLVHLAAREYALCREAACDAHVLAVAGRGAAGIWASAARPRRVADANEPRGGRCAVVIFNTPPEDCHAR